METTAKCCSKRWSRFLSGKCDVLPIQKDFQDINHTEKYETRGHMKDYDSSIESVPRVEGVKCGRLLCLISMVCPLAPSRFCTSPPAAPCWLWPPWPLGTCLQPLHCCSSPDVYLLPSLVFLSTLRPCQAEQLALSSHIKYLIDITQLSLEGMFLFHSKWPSPGPPRPL